MPDQPGTADLGEGGEDEEASLVGDRYIVWEGLPVAREVLATRVTRLLAPDDRDALDAALAGAISPSEMSPGTRALYEMLTNEDPRRTPALVADLPEELRDIIERFSPSTVADRITAPVFAMHSIDDPIVPYGELVRLERALPEADVSTVALFRHVDFDPRSFADWRAVAPDLARVWTLATWILSR